ncbi:transcriptional regulator [Leifsonia sp. LS1]|uniref:helix-turn-helix domain-containing protein n=1 Tax=Leifsonia sp. LS1 TaxID=2828483 RepID=UPI001CFEBC0E|nr:helix-turn-helix transcriptional regulator [Leifsonia sp. LS1]GIT79428.1 transcriptional regulator [Leifsonia sp. LS1]
MSGSHAELGIYLRARRDALAPADAGLSADARRRVPGLRRQEVAVLAGISPEYYLRLEQGKDHQPSPQVLLALGRALRLDADATDYLFRLAGQTVPSRRPAAAGPSAPSDPDALDSVTTFLDQWTSAPAYVVDRNQDILAVNTLARCFIPMAIAPGDNLIEAIVAGAEDSDAEPGAEARKPYWDGAIRSAAANLRYHADIDDPRLQLLVASLSSRCKLFRDAWGSHEAHPQRRGEALVDVAPFGLIPFRWQTLEVPGGGQYLATFFGDPGSPAAAAVEYLLAKDKVSRALGEAGERRPGPEELTEPGDG